MTIKPSPFKGEGRPKAGERGYSEETLKQAKSLRRSMTEAEKALWYNLRAKRLSGYKFRRQQPIGPYIVDFVHAESKVIVEADGSQHLENDHDMRRDKWLKSKGYSVLRFWNSEILTEMENVKLAILEAVETSLSKSD